MKLRLRYVVILVAAGMITWIALFPSDWQFWLGFSRAAYFTTGANYAFFSGSGMFLLALAGYTGIVVTMIRHLNCHVDGCPRISRHKVANGEYGVCSKHWRQVNGDPKNHKYTIEQLRERHHLYLGDRPGPG